MFAPITEPSLLAQPIRSASGQIPLVPWMPAQLMLIQPNVEPLPLVSGTVPTVSKTLVLSLPKTTHVKLIANVIGLELLALLMLAMLMETPQPVQPTKSVYGQDLNAPPTLALSMLMNQNVEATQLANGLPTNVL